MERIYLLVAKATKGKYSKADTLARVTQHYRKGFALSSDPCTDLCHLSRLVQRGMEGIFLIGGSPELAFASCSKFIDYMIDEPNPAFFMATMLDAYEFGDLCEMHFNVIITQLAALQISRYGVDPVAVMDALLAGGQDYSSIECTFQELLNNVETIH